MGLDLTPVQFAALSTLEENPGVDQATLAGLIAYDRATIGGVIDRLEAKGLLTRKVSERDRRAREIALSAAGRNLISQVRPAIRMLQEDILVGLDAKERQLFLQLAGRVAEMGNGLSRAPLVDRETG